MKKFILSFVMMMLVFTSAVNANSINSITMDIYIDSNGDADITEVWNCTTNQGTESYHPYYNLGESEITNLRVKDEDGKLFWECPQCGNRDQSKMNVARRTCGYIGTQYWNQGRTQEIKDRVLHL